MANGYWEVESVSVPDALKMAKKLFLFFEESLFSLEEYARKGGNDAMPIDGHDGFQIRVAYSRDCGLPQSLVSIEGFNGGFAITLSYSPHARTGALGNWAICSNSKREGELQDNEARLISECALALLKDRNNGGN